MEIEDIEDIEDSDYIFPYVPSLPTLNDPVKYIFFVCFFVWNYTQMIRTSHNLIPLEKP